MLLNNVVKNTTNSTIFIVDDESISRALFTKTVENIGPDINVKAFKSAPAALAAAETISPDLVITDYKMPVMNGIKYIRSEQGKHFDPVCVNALLDKLEYIKSKNYK